MSVLVPFSRKAQSAASGGCVALAGGDRPTQVGDLALRHGVSVERAQMLIDRYGSVGPALEAAARHLRAWKT